jgi:toxin FitB
MILLDTNVVSEPLKPIPDEKVRAWLASQPLPLLYLSTIGVAELLNGVAKLPDGRKREHLRYEINERLIPDFQGRILSFDMRAARMLAEITAGSRTQGTPINFQDAAIAATALAHGYTLATRNVRDFAGTGVKLVNPWE